MGHIVVEQLPVMERPVMVMSFRGWNDAGDAASSATDFMAASWDARRFAHVDPEEFYDFQATRPVAQLVEGTTRRIDWPENVFSYARVGGVDIVLFQGIEPNLRWMTFSREIIALGRELGARRLVTLGAFLADVPHTRAVPVVGSAGNAEEATDLGLSPSRYEGPTGIVGVIHDIANRTGLPSVSFWAGVPHYAPSGENPKAAVALLRRFSAYIDVDIDVSELEPEAQAWEDSVTEQVRQNEDLAEYIRSLEESGDGGVEPNGEELADEIERFLERRNGEDTP
jgi:predicted ATP-grasp superfamily ATP-dependent carboligase